MLPFSFGVMSNWQVIIILRIKKCDTPIPPFCKNKCGIFFHVFGGTCDKFFLVVEDQTDIL